MSQVKVQGNASGTGIFTVASPNSNTDRTLTLPDQTGTLVSTDANGNVGIGTSSPTVPLEVQTAAGSSYTVNLIGRSSDNASTINFWNNAKSSRNFIYSDTNLQFGTGGTERARISDTGQRSTVIPSGSTLYPAYDCRAWVNFNGTGTVAIRSSGNVSSITDNGTGDYTINFTTAMPDTNYSIKGSSCTNLGVRQVGFVQINCTGTTEVAPTTSACRIYTSDTSLTGVDFKYVSVAIFR